MWRRSEYRSEIVNWWEISGKTPTRKKVTDGLLLICCFFVFGYIRYNRYIHSLWINKYHFYTIIIAFHLYIIFIIIINPFTKKRSFTHDIIIYIYIISSSPKFDHSFYQHIFLSIVNPIISEFIPFTHPRPFTHISI